MKASFIKLHIGCFDQPTPGWYNTDISPHLWIARIPLAAKFLARFGLLGNQNERRLNQHREGIFRRVKYMDASKPFPFKSDSVQAVFSSHIIEHLRSEVAKDMLKECFRVLVSSKQGSGHGVCRVVAPGLDQLMKYYSEENPNIFLGGLFENTHKDPKNRHHWMYTASSLVQLMKDIGFVNVRECSFRVGQLPDLELIDNRPENSIYVEGVKP